MIVENVSLFDERNSTRQTSFTGLSFRGIESDYFVVVDGIGLGRPAIVAIPEENIGSITDRAVYTFNSDPRFGGFGVRVNDFEDSPGVIDIPERVGSTLVTQELPDSVFDFTSGDDLGSYLTEQGAGYFRKVGDFFVPVDESEIQTEADLKNLYFCDPAVSIDPVAQFMDPTTGDIAPTLGGNVPPRDAYDGTSAIELYCVCVNDLPFFNTSPTEAGTEGVDFWYDGEISPNFDQDAFWYRGAAPLEEGGDSKYWFKFKNTDTTDELTGGGEYALVATKRDALDNGQTLDSLTGEYVFSKSFASPDGIRLYAGIDEAAIQELSNFGAEDIEVYRWDVAAGQIVGTDGREILGGRLDNRFDTIGDEYAGSLSELNNNAYLDTLA